MLQLTEGAALTRPACLASQVLSFDQEGIFEGREVSVPVRAPRRP